MGTLAQVAAGVGTGMVSNVTASRREDELGDNRAHEETLQRMRELAMSGLQEDKQAHEMEKYGIARKDAATDLGEQRGYDEGIAATDRENELADATTGHERDLELQGLKNSGAISLQTAKDKPDDYQSVKVSVAVGVDNFGGVVEEETPLTFQKSTGRYFQERGGVLMPYDLVQNLPEDEKMLATDPLYGLAYALAKGGTEKLPEWYKVAHKSTYEAIQREYKKKEDSERPGPTKVRAEAGLPLNTRTPPEGSGGGNKGSIDGGVLDQGVKARAEPGAISNFMNMDATDLGPAVVDGVKGIPGAVGNFLTTEIPYGQ